MGRNLMKLIQIKQISLIAFMLGLPLSLYGSDGKKSKAQLQSKLVEVEAKLQEKSGEIDALKTKINQWEQQKKDIKDKKTIIDEKTLNAQINYTNEQSR